MSYDKRITDLAAEAALAASKNAKTAPQLLMAPITFVLADAIKDGRISLGRDGSAALANVKNRLRKLQPALNGMARDIVDDIICDNIEPFLAPKPNQ